MREFAYEIKAHLGTISKDDDGEKSVKLISYNGRKPKYDIRTWRGSKMLKGITLTEEEARQLYKILGESL